MRRTATFILLIAGITAAAVGEISVKNNTTVFYSYGVADETQMLPDTYQGVYDDKKNGQYLSNKIQMVGSLEDRYDYNLQLTATVRTGSSYSDLQLGASDPAYAFGLSLDSLWIRLRLSEVFFPDAVIAGSDVALSAKIGKFGLSPVDAAISRFGLESVQGMLKMANSQALSLEAVFGKASLELASGGLFDEAVERLYDGNGSMGQVGQPVVGEYAPQFFARLSSGVLSLPFGNLSSGASYAYNGAGIYSDHSFGASASLTVDLIPGRLQLPLGLSFASYDKNIDALAGFAGTKDGAATTRFRETMRVGYAVGARYLGSRDKGGRLKPSGELTLSGSYSSVEHFYRDPIEVMNLGIDGRYAVLPGLHVGGGYMLGTLSDFIWKTSGSVSPAYDDFYRSYAPADNMGYEIYIALEGASNFRVSIGYAHLKGLSMNHGLESIPNGMVKYRQTGTAVADMLWETRAVYVLADISL